MKMYEIIHNKREGNKHSAEEISHLIEGYVDDEIPDYQVSAWAMAVYFQGMDAEETAFLTEAVVSSGDRIDLSPLSGTTVDKHSTGGVGDTTTLVLVPLVAAAGVPVPKMSGRGLGHTGGTIDKLESIPGLDVEMSRREFLDQVEKVGAAVVGQTANLTPADKKLYSLRDVTATVDSPPLIASSIMGKKIAGGADSIVLDVKTGSGAFMQKIEAARELAELMVGIGKELDRKTLALLTDMSQPLGRMVGNSLEVKEAINTLSGEGPEDLEKLCLELGAAMLKAGGYSTDMDEAQSRLKEQLNSGNARRKLAEIIAAQGGEAGVVEDPGLLPSAENIESYRSPAEGYIADIDARRIGRAAMLLGAGRETKEDEIDYSAGIELMVSRGDPVEKDQMLARLHHGKKAELEEAEKLLKSAFSISGQPPADFDFIIDLIE